MPNKFVAHLFGIISFVFGMTWAIAAESTEYHVSPQGNPLGDGSSSCPWDLQTALDGAPGVDQQPRIHPGDTCWLHGGRYRGGYKSRLMGTVEAPITVRQAPNERATIDCDLVNKGGDPSLMIEGGHTDYWGFEVTCTNPRRETEFGGPWPSDLQRGGINCRGSNVKFINLSVHDLGNGIGFWSEAEGGEIYGCLIYHNGWKGPDHGHGHGIYSQNKLGQKRFVDNILFNQFGYGIHCYGTSMAFLNGFHIEGNTGFNNGCLNNKDEHNPAIFVGGGTPVHNLTMTRNFIFGGTLRCGYASDVLNDDVTVTDNFVNGTLTIQKFQKVVATGNTIVASDTLIRVEFPEKFDAHQYKWDRNHFIRTGGRYPPFNWRRDARDRADGVDEWRSATNLDLHSEMRTAPSSLPVVFIRPNQYESGRAHLVIFNPDRVEAVDVDLSSLLKDRQKYSIFSAQDPFGKPVFAGQFDGRSIRLPMKPTSIARPIGMPDYVLPITQPEFGVFLVLPSS